MQGVVKEVLVFRRAEGRGSGTIFSGRWRVNLFGENFVIEGEKCYAAWSGERTFLVFSGY